MAEYDGSIRIGTIIDSEKAKKELAALRNQLVSQTREIDNQAKAVNRLQAQYDKLKNASPKGADKLASDLEKAKEEAQKLSWEYGKWGALQAQYTAKHGEASPEIDTKLEEIGEKSRAADDRVAALQTKLSELKMSPESVERLRQLEQQIAEGTTELERMKAEAQDTAARIENLSDRSQSWPARLGGLVSRMGKAMVSAGGKASAAIGKLRDKIRGLGREKGFDKASKSAGRLATRLRSIVTGALFFNIISRGLTALTKKIGEYLTANKKFADALGGVKSNLLTAFQPVYDAVMPALTKLMEALEGVTAKVAAFMATIFGTTAKEAQENAKALNEQADATEAVGKETKKASKFLASFDTIERVGSNDSGSTSETEAAPQFNTDFSNIKPPQWLLDIWKAFRDGWAQYGEPTVAAFKGALEALHGVISSIGLAFLSVWTGGSGLAVLNGLQVMLQTILGLIGSIATAFRTAWDAGNGVQIIETIHSILKNIITTVTNIASGLKRAWEENGNGKAIWAAILRAVEIVLSTVDRLAASTASWAAQLDFGPLLSSLRAMFEALLPVLQQISDIVTWIWENILLPAVGWLIETGLPAVINFITSLLEGLQKYPEILEALTALVAAFVAAWAIGKIISGVTALVQSMNPLVAVLSLALVLFTAIAGAWDDMSGLQKAIAVIGALIAVAATAAIAVGALQSALTIGIAAAAIVAGIVAVTAAISSATNKAKTEGSRYSSAMNAQAGGSGNYNARNIGGYDLTQYPHLASGAVISPNSEFLAVLGDQRNGRNLEAPEGLIRQIMREELGNMAGGLGQTNVRVEFSGSLAQLARVLQPHITTETARLGPQLITGGGLA